MAEGRLDNDVEEFRGAGHQLIDWIANYFREIERYPVVSRVQPGEVRDGLSRPLSKSGRPYSELLADFEKSILPGITHWNHPGFMAYFAITGSQAGILGELLCAALNTNGMIWKTSPAVTELETLILERLRDALGLPRELFGIINDTASINSFLALAAARESLGLSIRGEGMTGRDLPRLRIYCSDQTNLSIEKGALALGFGSLGIWKIETDEAFRMRADLLQKAIAEDRASGVIPCAIVATVGTTSTAAVDPLGEIGLIAAAADVWLHVDAAYAGSAAVDPRHRWIWDGIEHADSVVVNPHKWLFTPIDCSVLYLREPDWLKETFSLTPEYLRTSETDVINFADYGLQLGRRFRALKLWFVLEHYGIDRIARTIGHHIELAQKLAGQLKRRDDIELLAPPSFSLVVFRKIVRSDGIVDEEMSEKVTAALLDQVNDSGSLFLSSTRLRGKLGIRVAIGNGATEWRHVERLLDYL